MIWFFLKFQFDKYTYWKLMDGYITLIWGQGSLNCKYKIAHKNGRETCWIFYVNALSREIHVHAASLAVCIVPHS